MRSEFGHDCTYGFGAGEETRVTAGRHSGLPGVILIRGNPGARLPDPEAHYDRKENRNTCTETSLLITMPLLNRLQKYSLALLVVFMLTDIAISSWGVLYAPGFTEANTLFSRLVHRPLQFIAAIGAAKLAVMAGIIAATIWFNRREPAGEAWHGGDIICSTAALGMGAMLLVLVAGNLVVLS